MNLGRSYLGGVHYLAALSLLGAIFLGIVISHPPPAVRGADTPPSQFSAARAERDVRGLTAFGPRAVGARWSKVPGQPATPAHEASRIWVEGRLRELGLSPIEQAGDACDGPTCGRVVNVLARLDPPGVAPGTPALLLLAHYDSVPQGPGAGDDAAGVATIFETLRALQHEPPAWRHPLIVVIDDGEEAGLLGARLFMQHPWAQQVGVVLNFEARGTAGQAAMFETSPRSLWLVREYARAVERPVAASVIYPLYKRLPNDTDLTVTSAAGLQGLNFAFAERDWLQHTQKDSIENLDLRSVQHMGDQALAVARRLLAREVWPHPSGDGDPDGDGVWFELFTQRLVVYSAATARLLALGQLAIFLAALAVVLRRDGRTGARWLGIGLVRALLAVIVAVATGFVIVAVIKLLAGRPRPWRTAPLPTWAALTAAALAVPSALQHLLDHLRPARSLRAIFASAVGGLLPWTVLSIVTAWREVAASALFLWPALLGSTALLAALLRTPRDERADQAGSPRAQIASIAWVQAGLLGGALVWFPLARILYVMAGANLHVTATLPAGLLIALSDPQHALLPPRLRPLIPTLLGLVALGCIAAAAWL
ncbi:MAG: M20/M25/M40 family metallo-hydrolase [Polyangia bacterium]